MNVVKVVISVCVRPSTFVVQRVTHTRVDSSLFPDEGQNREYDICSQEKYYGTTTVKHENQPLKQ